MFSFIREVKQIMKVTEKQQSGAKTIEWRMNRAANLFFHFTIWLQCALQTDAGELGPHRLTVVFLNSESILDSHWS